jgi:hypothetical protein
MGEINAYEILVGRLEGKGPLGSPKGTWEGNIRLDIGETGWGDVDWIHPAQDKDQ